MSVFSFFVYGTLRSDCPHQAPWRDDFHVGEVAKYKAIIKGHRLFFSDYPVICGTDGVSDVVVGEIVQFPPSMMPLKVKMADYIEGAPDFYTRVLVDAFVLDREGSETSNMIQCYTYVRELKAICTKKPISGGCWVSHNSSTDDKKKKKTGRIKIIL
ncbi:hypothetical protein AKO1_005842 [Acrasis kona]|uniref:Gamma-glutamylcyclotransferase AIG2-like domain-containing protein n=1 Tax=Acrasis kona TaxID=1008807 RepID=A0AAW2YJH5_9EUKA